MGPLCELVERLRAVAARLDALKSKKGHPRPVSMPLTFEVLEAAEKEIQAVCDDLALFIVTEGGY